MGPEAIEEEAMGEKVKRIWQRQSTSEEEEREKQREKGYKKHVRRPYSAWTWRFLTHAKSQGNYSTGNLMLKNATSKGTWEKNAQRD